MADITDWMSLAQPNAEWEAAVKQMPQRPDMGVFPDIATLRSYILQLKRQVKGAVEPLADVDEEDRQIPVRDGSTITIRTYTPHDKSDSPLLVVFHGGGWCIGALENEEILCRRAASELGFVVVNVEYRLAPEHKFPTAAHDAYDATKWAAANASSLKADPSKGFVVAGTSAGANLATVATLLARDEGLSPPITGCHLMIPALVADVAVPEVYKAEYRSWDQNEHADILSRKACHLFSSNYVPNPEDYKNPLFSPLIWETGFANFPTTSFQICGADPLRDEGLIFERHLRKDEGVKTRVDVYPGVPHGFYSIIPSLQVSKKYADESVEGLRWHLT